MVSLVDIGPLTAPITIRGQEFELKGLPVAVIFEVMKDNVAIKKMLMDRSVNAEDLMMLVQTTPSILAQIIAAAFGKMGDDATIRFAMFELYAGEQAEIVEKVLGISFPHGLPQFIDTLRNLFSGQAEASGKAADTKSPPGSPDASATATA
jgi:hypothetical protein